MVGEGCLCLRDAGLLHRPERIEVPRVNSVDIQRIIPHRPPFLWIDEVVERTESRIHARTTVAADLDLFRGHYPDFPVLPGVIQCEMCFQAGALLIAAIEPVEEGRIPVVTRQTDTQFRRMVRPGETLDIEVELTERLANAFYMTGRTSVGGKVATRLSFAATTAALPD
jgi:3-hydroxyacyl-[acyl-carrier-protein] dehydratase